MLDTGAGSLALDESLAVLLGLSDSLSGRSVAVAERPLPRLQFGSTTADQVSPVLLFDAEVLARVTGQDVLGLLGQRVVRDRVLWIDYQSEIIGFIPGGPDLDVDDNQALAASRRLLRGLLSQASVPVRFRIAGDGKVLLPVRITPLRGGASTPWLTFVLDTGASKCVVFEDVVEPLAPVSRWRPEVRGLRAPTLVGVSAARLSVARRIELRGASTTAAADRVEMALLRSPIAEQLEEVAREPIHGLLGYSFLQRFRIACDYPRRVLWLDPVPEQRWNATAERGHVGIQIEGVGGRIRVVAVAEGSAADRAGVRIGDEVLRVDHVSVASKNAVQVGRLLQGTPGTSVRITLLRGGLEKTYRIRRRRIL